MPFHFSSGISVFIIEHVPGFFSMRHSLTSLTLDLLLLLLTCHAIVRRKRARINAMSARIFLLQKSELKFSPPLLTLLSCYSCWYVRQRVVLLARQLVVNLATFSQTASSQEPYFQQAHQKNENFFKLLIKIISIKGNIDIP